MTHKIKSFLFFASFVIAMVVYTNLNDANDVQNTELAENTIEQVSTDNTIN